MFQNATVTAVLVRGSLIDIKPEPKETASLVVGACAMADRARQITTNTQAWM